MEKIKDIHLEIGLREFMEDTNIEEVTTHGVFDKTKFRKALTDFISASFANNPNDEDRTLLIVASSEEEAREKFNKLLDTYGKNSEQVEEEN